MEINLEAVLAVSANIVAREIENELIIVPLTAGVGDLEDELYTLNESGRAIWALLDGQRSLHQVVDELAQEFDSPVSEIEADVLGLMDVLLTRGILELSSHG